MSKPEPLLPQQAYQVKKALECFCFGMRQPIHWSKCSLLFNGRCPTQVRDEICGVLQTQIVTFEEKYLGQPTSSGRMKKSWFQLLTERLEKRMVSYLEWDLSVGAKEY